MNFIGKVVRRKDSFFPKQLLTACVNHKRKHGGVLTTNKKSVVTALGLLYPDTVWRRDENGTLYKDAKGKKIPETIHMDRLGSLKYWFKDAMDKKRWSWMIESKLRSPHLNIPDPSPPNPPQPAKKYHPPRRSRRQQQHNHNHLPPSTKQQWVRTGGSRSKPQGLARYLRIQP